MGGGEGKFAWVFESVTIIFSSYLLLPCYYTSPGPAPKSFSSHEGQKPLISNSQAEKMVRDLPNLIYHVLFLVLYVDIMQHKILTVERITLNYPAEFSEGGAIQENCTLLQCVHVTVTTGDAKRCLSQHRQLNQGSFCRFYGSFNWSMGGRKKWMGIAHVLDVPEQNGKGSFTTAVPHLNIRIKSDFAASFI